MATQYAFGKIVTNGLILALDAADKNSYPGTGTAWNDLSGRNAHGTIVGSVAFVNSGAQSYFNFATANDSNYISSTVSQTYLDFTAVFLPDFTYNPVSTIVGLIGTNTPASLADKSLRFGTGGSNPWSLTGRNPGDTNDWANPSATTYYVNGIASNTLVSGWNIFGGYRTNQSGGIGFPSSFSYHLGSSAYTGRSFQGRIACMYMYNRQLSANEQLQNYNALKSRFGLI
jgi:hypothetical protein